MLTVAYKSTEYEKQVRELAMIIVQKQINKKSAAVTADNSIKTIKTSTNANVQTNH